MLGARLHVVEGPDRGQERVLTLARRLVVGRGAECELRLNDAQASRRHCALELRPGGLWVEDLGSRAGTELLGRWLQSEGVLVPPADARLRIGGSELRVVAEPAGAPREVAGYEVDGLLGEGGSGSVYAGRERSSGRAVALKFLHLEADAEAVARTAREAALAQRLDHPGIARVLALVEGEPPVLVRELAPGPTLAHRIGAGPLPWREAFAIGAALADALAAAHAEGVVHRDLKPENVVCSPRGPCLIDFDLAGLFGAGNLERTLTRLTRTGQGLGTLCYLPPEQLSDARGAGPRADLYGLGLTLHHAISGAQPFADVEPEDLLSAIRSRGRRPLAGIPAAAEAVLARACALAPEARYADAGAFADALRAAAAS